MKAVIDPVIWFQDYTDFEKIKITQNSNSNMIMNNLTKTHNHG